MSAADGGSWKPQQIEPIDLSGHGIAADLRERSAALWALMMGAAAALEDAANCLTDTDAKKAAKGAAKHYRKEANALWPNSN